MNFYVRLSCLLLCFTLLLFGFTTTANAEEVEVPESFTILQQAYIQSGSYKKTVYSNRFYPNDGEVQKNETVFDELYASELDMQGIYGNYYQVIYNDEDIILEEDETYTVRLNNIYFSALLNINGTKQYVRKPTIQYLHLVDHNDNRQTITDFQITQQDGSPSFNLSFNCTPEFDVRKIIISVQSSIADVFPSYDIDDYCEVTVYTGEMLGDDKYQFSLEVESQEAGLLKGVIQWLTSIKDGITNLFQSIAELPSKLWTLISDGLKSLFVPDEEFITGFKEDMGDLLESKLGALYQVVDITFGSWDRVMSADETNTIEIPLVTIPLPDNNEFSFGGETVQIVPEGFDFMANFCKSVTGMACCWLFISGLKKRYDQIMER